MIDSVKRKYSPGWQARHPKQGYGNSLFAEIERDLISERTKEGLIAARAKGRILGRPKGSHGSSRLDGKETEIQVLLGKKVLKTSIAKILDVSRSALLIFHQFPSTTLKFGPLLHCRKS